MKFDRKLLLIAPTIVLLFVAGGMAYATMQLRVLAQESTTWQTRSDFIASVEKGERSLTERQALTILRYSLEVERGRTAAIQAASDLLLVLAIIAAVCLLALAEGIRRVPREHWPRFGAARQRHDAAP